MIDLLIAPCGQLLTLANGGAGPRRGAEMSSIGLVTDGALGIERASGCIAYAGAESGLPKSELTADCEVMDASAGVVMPGFVDSHTHLVFAGERADEFYRRSRGESYAEIAQSGGGIRKTMAATRAASAESLYQLAGNRLAELYRNGTTAIETKSGYGLDFESEMKCLSVARRLRDSAPGIVLSTFLGAHALPPEYSAYRAGYVAEVCRILEHAVAADLADFYDVFVDPLAFSADEASQIAEVGKRLGLPLKLHADEFGDDGTAAWGVSQSAISIDHLGGIGHAGIHALAASNTIATLLPATMFFSGHGQYAPARRLIDAGCAVALATDLNPGSSLVYSMPLVLTIAVLEMGLSAEECLAASTINGAHALGIAEKTGSLERGKRADAIVLNVADYREIAYHVGRDIVRDVIIGGKNVKHAGQMRL